MKTYKAYIVQNTEGCDYTIGCAQKVIEIEANSLDEAKQKLFVEIRENYSHWEKRLETAELYEVEQTFSVNLKDLYKQIDSEKEEEERRKKEDADRLEFERLKSKFGPQGS